MKKMLISITEDIWLYFCDYGLLSGVIAFITIIFVGVLQWIRLAQQEKRLDEWSDKKQLKSPGGIGNLVLGLNWQRYMYIFLLVFYWCMILGITIFSRSESGVRECNLQLFRTFQKTFRARKQIYENIIMFMPYSMILYAMTSCFRKSWLVLLVGSSSSLLIEAVQWMTCTGYFELDDILTNTLGMLFGYILAVMLYKKWMLRGDRAIS